jgi:spermidine synthase
MKRAQEPGLGWRRGAALLGIFMVSGATALVYQILWVRELSLTLGSTVQAISLVVSAFMAGLALGSLGLGARADRSGSPLRVYAALEAGIGICALVVPFVFGALERLATASPDARSAAAPEWLPFVIAFVVLLVPTTLMGATLPVLSRYVAGFSLPRGATIGLLYGFNTIGAVAGTALAGFVLIRAFGVRRTTELAAVANLLLFAAAFVLSRRWPSPAPAVPDASGARGSERDLLAPVVIVYFVAGFVGLALEVLWTRAVVLLTTNTIYAFTVILTTFLVGLAAGSSIMSAFLPRVRRLREVLGGIQVLIGVLAAITPLAIDRFALTFFQSVEKAATESMGLAGRILTAYLIAIPFILPATLLMGAAFPLIARVVADATERVGRAVGSAYAVNTAGAVLGSLVGTFGLLPAIGIQRSILTFSLVSVAGGAYLLARSRSRAWLSGSAAAGAVVVAMLVASPNHFRSMLSRTFDADLTFYREGVEATVAAYDSPNAARPVLAINNTALDDRGVVHQLLAHLPALIHPNPERVLVLGFGVGITSQSFSTYGVPVNDCVEISPEVMEAAPRFAELNGNIAARGDPSFRLHVTDGRRFLLSGGERYDIIALDANSGDLRNAGVGKLYTVDFFKLCRDRLRPAGLVTLYASPNAMLTEYCMVLRTFQEVFPHATLWLDLNFGQTSVLVGSVTPIRIELRRFLERKNRPEVLADLRRFDLDQPGALLSSYLMGEEMIRYFCRDAELNTDDHPVMEFFPLRTNAFALDDRPRSDFGLLLRKESVLCVLDTSGVHDAPSEAALEFIRGEERAFPSVVDAWLHQWFGNPGPAAATLGLAAELHPESERLRTLIGAGRRRLADARAAAAERTSERLGLLGAISLRRGEPDSALAQYERAIERAENASPPLDAAARRGLYSGAARGALRTGRADRARELLARARAAGDDVTVDSLDVELMCATSDTARTRLLAAIANAAFPRLLLFRTHDALVKLSARRALDSSQNFMLARCLESFGDLAGAYLRYRDARSASAGPPGEDLRRVALELALRADVLEKAYRLDGAARPPAITSIFTGERVPTAELPVRAHDRAEPWLELADLYLRAARPVVAYRKARVARIIEPGNVNTYLALGRTAAAVGAETVARKAFRAALLLDGRNAAAHSALRRLDAGGTGPHR